MIRDRGNIKWTSMMLPEHVKELRDWKAEERRKSKPVLDEQKMEEMNEIICEAMEFHYPLYFHYFENGETKILYGYVHYLDQLSRELRILDQDERKRKVSLSNLIHIETE
ncbi:YolD-like family protein [Bacillus sp. NTK071]|uniref:YolD-like family protein n=1 Tax=Bacillus sp. NTK071 TaxID=2802175 RepID=UPI001A8DB62B|nr:YolD-like family protein [Bacillus sp. NTK071]MBN8208151.1 YolD-like family protein [Bacillus sp. NTK071]